MTTQGLAQSEKHLLERYHDGVLVGEERDRAERLLAQVSLARDFASGLKEISTATRAAEQELWAQSDAPSSEALWQAAMQPTEPLTTQNVSALSPMLVRFHDGEVTEQEAAEIEELMQVREDVSAFLGGLGELELGVQGATKEAVDAVDFGGFWDKLEQAIDSEQESTHEPEELRDAPNVLSFPESTRERPSFNDDDHQVLLYRYHDGEASADECRQVQAWQEIDPKVAATLGALEELELAARASMELAEEHIEPGLMWSMIEDRLEVRDNVASLAAHREAKQAEVAIAPVSNHRREMFIALAAVLCTVMGVTLFGDGLFSGDKVIVEKTVVIVDSLEYGDGTSVMVTGPMQTASMEIDGSDEVIDDEDSLDEEATPTVIWLIDPEADVQERDEDVAPPGDSPEGEEIVPRGKPI